MTTHKNSLPDELIDRFIRQFFDGVKIPKKYKKKKNSDFPPIPDAAILQIAFSTGKDGYSTRIIVDEITFHVSMTRHLLRVWVNTNWNIDAPSLEGDAVLASMRRGVEEIRRRLADLEAEETGDAVGVEQ